MAIRLRRDTARLLLGFLVLSVIVALLFVLYLWVFPPFHSFPSDCGHFGTWTSHGLNGTTVTWTGTLVCT